MSLNWKWHNLRVSRMRYRQMIRRWTHNVIAAVLLVSVCFMSYMAATAYMSLSDERERALTAQAEAFELLNGRMFMVDGTRFRLATEQLPKLIGEP